MIHRSDVDEHAVWAALDEARTAFVDPEVDFDGWYEAQLQTLPVLEAARATHDRVDRALVRASDLREVQTKLSALRQWLDQATANPSYYANQWVSPLDQLRASIARLPLRYGNVRANASVAREMKDLVADLTRVRENTTTRGEEVISQIDNRELDASRQLEEVQARAQEISRSFDALQGAIESTSATQQQTQDAALIALNTQGSQAIAEIDARFKRWVENQERELDDVFEPLSLAIGDAKAQATEDRRKIGALLESSEELTQLVAAEKTSGAYAKRAKVERRTAMWAYGLGGCIGALGITAVVLAFAPIASAMSWPVAALKISIAAGAGGLATVAFRLGGQALSRATSFTRQELELRALVPFLAAVQGADEAKVAFFKRAFGHAWDRSSADESLDVEQVTKLVEALKPLIQTAESVIKPITATPAN